MARKDRRVLQTPDMVRDFAALCKEHCSKHEGKPDFRSGKMFVQLTRKEIADLLRQKNHDLVVTENEDGQTVQSSVQACISSYGNAVKNTVVDLLRQKLLGEKPQFVEFATLHKFVAEQTKIIHGESKSWSEIPTEEFQELAEDFIESLEAGDLIKFKDSQRGRESVKADLVDIAL